MGARVLPHWTNANFVPWAAANEQELWGISEINDLVSAYNVPRGGEEEVGAWPCVYASVAPPPARKHQIPSRGNESRVWEAALDDSARVEPHATHRLVWLWIGISARRNKHHRRHGLPVCGSEDRATVTQFARTAFSDVNHSSRSEKLVSLAACVNNKMGHKKRKKTEFILQVETWRIKLA